jgi:hypothetical protein
VKSAANAAKLAVFPAIRVNSAVPDLLVRNIDELVAERIKQVARERQLSINEVILQALRDAVGLGDGDLFRREMHDIAVLAGTWDSSETAAFRSAVEAFEKRDGRPLFSDPKDQPPK